MKPGLGYRDIALASDENELPLYATQQDGGFEHFAHILPCGSICGRPDPIDTICVETGKRSRR
jgi:hypothetical protein